MLFRDKILIWFLLLLHSSNFDGLHLASKILEKGLGENSDLHAFMTSLKHETAKLLLFMFNLCHIMILYHPNHTLDMNYIKLFQASHFYKWQCPNCF